MLAGFVHTILVDDVLNVAHAGSWLAKPVVRRMGQSNAVFCLCRGQWSLRGKGAAYILVEYIFPTSRTVRIDRMMAMKTGIEPFKKMSIMEHLVPVRSE